LNFIKEEEKSKVSGEKKTLSSSKIDRWEIKKVIMLFTRKEPFFFISFVSWFIFSRPQISLLKYRRKGNDIQQNQFRIQCLGETEQKIFDAAVCPHFSSGFWWNFHLSTQNFFTKSMIQIFISLRYSKENLLFFFLAQCEVLRIEMNGEARRAVKKLSFRFFFLSKVIIQIYFWQQVKNLIWMIFQ